MEPAPRYEIVNTIASGDFAAVYRARDRELGREVAVKQIHPQFLADPRQLARYWQEAQLLASLQHPNILTIYDIVRPRGWLILELMRGSLKQTADGEPIDLGYLRSVLKGCLQGLHFLHTNGVIHGDVKPSNMLVGTQNRVKLGDFGLARRASNEEGSLLKGTTKYMAPELLSPQFGAVGPASDLYSLGFSAYELLCGSQFETLLPSLGTFGRDKQIGWMMWHSAADVKLPEIRRVLEGVPDDLAHVIERLTIKDQSRRYASAEEALYDLRGSQPSHGEPPPPDPAAEMAALAAARRKRRLRVLGLVAVAVSLVLSAGILLMSNKPKRAPAGPPPALHGVVTSVYPDEMKLAVTTSEDHAAKGISLTRYDRIFINDEPRLLRELQPHDKVIIEKVLDERSHRLVSEVRAFRPKMHKGRIRSLKADEGTFALDIEEGDDRGKQLVVNVAGDSKILLNGKPELNGKPVRLSDLGKDDRVVVHHVGEEMGRRATELDVERIVETQGTVVDDFDARSGLLSIVTGTAQQPQIVKLPFAQQFIITINGQPAAKPTSLKKDDRVTVKHDTRIVEVKATRTLDAMGVIQQVRYEAPQTLSVLGDNGQAMTCLVGPQCKISLGGEPVTLDDLRPGDTVRIAHGALDPKNQEAVQATAIAAVRPADSARWAILIAGQNYDDKSLTPLNTPLADAKLLGETLVKRYQVPAEQILLLADESLVRLEQSIPDRLKQVGADAKLIVYFSGHAYKDDQGAVYLAPKNFDLKRIKVTGLALQWLVDQLEACPSKEKLLLLDACQSGQGADLALEPSAAEMLRSLKVQASRALLRTVAAVASCTNGQRGLAWTDKGHGLFAWCLAQGYSGLADANRDNRLEVTELFGYLQQAMAKGSSELKGAQTPELFLPDDRPPRLTEDAKKAVRRLAAFLTQTRVDVDSAGHEYAVARKLAGKEIEPRLMYALVLLKAKDRDSALAYFEELKSENPDLLLPLQGLVWVRFDKRAYPAGVNELAGLVRHIPKPKTPAEEYSPEARHVFFWAGQLRGFVSSAVQDAGRPMAEALSNLDAAVAAHGPKAEELYQKGRARSETVVAEFDKRTAATDDDATAKLLKVQRRQLVHYAEFPFDEFAQQILAKLSE